MRLNQFPQFRTAIDGTDIHFLHIRSPERDALPLVMTHGWPGSVAEFLNVIGPLTDPRGHGDDPADAVHLVVPSIPGFGFSPPPRVAGWNARRVAEAFAVLMARLGYGWTWAATNTSSRRGRRPYYEEAHTPAGQRGPGEPAVPVGVTVFTGDTVLPVRRLAENANPHIISWSEVDGGGHFAAMEAPATFIEEVRRFFRQFR